MLVYYEIAKLHYLGDSFMNEKYMKFRILSVYIIIFLEYGRFLN